jgi:hypothetical protein
VIGLRPVGRRLSVALTSDTFNGDVTSAQPMTDKVKVSMFLPPAVAHALKVQAVRQGGRSVGTGRRLFICAHCREPIADEFIVGKSKLIEPNRYAVLFHKNRPACVAASGTRIRCKDACADALREARSAALLSF